MQLDPATTALVLIDLQDGIVQLAGGPRDGDAVVSAAKLLAQRCRAAGAPVVLVHVSFAPGNAPSRNADKPSLPERSPPEFSKLVDGLQQEGDVVVEKHHWGAFTGTDLDLQLRRRNVRTVVIAGIATNMGVESTARSAWELSYDVMIAEDACAGRSAELHAFAVDNIFPLFTRVVQSDAITFA